MDNYAYVQTVDNSSRAWNEAKPPRTRAYSPNSPSAPTAFVGGSDPAYCTQGNGVRFGETGNGILHETEPRKTLT